MGIMVIDPTFGMILFDIGIMRKRLAASAFDLPPEYLLEVEEVTIGIGGKGWMNSEFKLITVNKKIILRCMQVSVSLAKMGNLKDHRDALVELVASSEYGILHLFSHHQLQFTNLKYFRVEIDEVRFEWAECMLDYI
ncbi:hypothetical protein ZIOFF_060243 [Zingiber officinale]|uniref:Uncharacterized protein n=1 Tax=Zingiber officinale TaxID=94328 RepID=A0A8J5FBA1_ZINOF|nr:hypothetical protein ZIOFF_060243 [Zingiber officinale]